MKRVEELLVNHGGSYILPFFWMHGESHDIIKEEIDRVEECGIHEICLESRPHPDYCGPGWWSDVDFIMDECKKRNMRVWILDDDKFPTGHANGAFRDKYPELAKVYLAERHIDIIGPAKDGAVLIQPFLGGDGKLLGVLACKKPDTQTLAVSGKDMIDLTNHVENGFVYFDLPKGRYRLFILYTTQKRGGREDYMNLIDAKSVRVLIDEVYEKHYERYKEDFGKTLAGFFSDEPEMGNTPGYDFHELLGKRDVKLPWSNELSEELRKLWKNEFLYHLPALWYEMDEKAAVVRTDYMECVTNLLQKNFAGQIGEWCEQHQVEYIGHIIEDDNAHNKLGCSIGHYYREQKGQHMSGIDVVHHQIIPGFNDKIHQWIAGDGDGEFFHYGLAKMGSSLAHIDPKKQGRAMCEIFGNYGWAEGVSFMKWLTNHMLVRGINRYVPHAFSPKFPDLDCPPHFYARGNNPQFKHFAELMKYMNRVCHLISDGVHRADAAVLYHGEAEWGGKKTMFFQKPVRKLMEAQLDCDIIPVDVLQEDFVSVSENKLWIHQESYGCLVLPYCEMMPHQVIKFVTTAAKAGLTIYMLDALPTVDTKGNEIPREFEEAVQVIKLGQLPRIIKTVQKTEILCEKEYKSLRFYCYEQVDGKVYLFFNEDHDKAMDLMVTIGKGKYNAITEYNPMMNESCSYRINDNMFPLQLEPGELRILIPMKEETNLNSYPKCRKKQPIKPSWRVSLKENLSNEFVEGFQIKSGEKLPNLNGPGYYTGFTGTYRYEGKFQLQEEWDGQIFLYLQKFGDCAQISINGKDVGMLLASPDRINVTDVLIQGENQLVIDITNTLVWTMKDGASTHMQVEATGLNKAPVLEFYQ